METQSHDTSPKARLEAVREQALGTLSRVKETLQVAATTAPVWVRGVELKAGEQVDALLERVGLIRIAKAEALHAKAAVEETITTIEPEIVEASASVEETPAVEATESTETHGSRASRRRKH